MDLSFCFPRRQRLMGIARAILPLAVLVAAGARSATAQAQSESAGQDVSQRHDDEWNFLVGAGAVNLPRYPGSRFDYTRGLPAVSISYGRYFLGGAASGGAPAGLGAYLVRNEHWKVGLSVGGDFRKPRRASDDPILRGWGDIAAGVRGGVFATYSIEWFSIHGAVSAAGHSEGVTASLNPEVELHPTPRLTLSLGPQVIWGNEQYQMTFFGVDSVQAQIAGIGPHHAGAGINMVGATIGSRYRFTDHWMVGLNAGVGRLEGDAASSPVTTDKTQREIAAFVLYRF